MVDKYKLRDYGLDFMGYVINSSKDVTYHHLVISKRNGGKETVKNGAILIKNSHKYLHLIERDDYNRYLMKILSYIFFRIVICEVIFFGLI